MGCTLKQWYPLTFKFSNGDFLIFLDSQSGHRFAICYLAKAGLAVLLPEFWDLGIMSGFAMVLLKRASMGGILKINSSESSLLEDFFKKFKRSIIFTAFSIL